MSHVALNADGTLLATSGGGLSVRVWDAKSGALVRDIAPPAFVVERRGPGRGQDMAAMAFAANSRRWLHVLTENGVLRRCDVGDGSWTGPLARATAPADRFSFAGGRVSPDRTRFLYTPRDGKANRIEVLVVGQEKPVLRIDEPKFGQENWGMSVSADNGLLAAVLDDGTAKVWDLTTGEAVATHAPPAGVFRGVALSPDGRSVAAVYRPKYTRNRPTPDALLLYGWDRATGKERFRIPDWQGTGAEYTPDGSRLVSFAKDGMLVADAATGKLNHRLAGHGGWNGSWSVSGYAFSPDGQYLVTGGSDHTAIIWDLATGKAALDFDSPRGEVDVLAFSPDGKTLFAGTGRRDHAAGLWDADTGKRRHRLVADGEGFPHSASFSPDGRHVAVGYGLQGPYTRRDWSARLWGVADGKLVRSFPGHTGGIPQVAFSPDGKRLMTRDWGKKVRLWDADAGTVDRTIDWVDYNVPAVLAFPRADELIGASADRDKQVEVVDLTSGKALGRFKTDDHSTLLALSPDGRLAVAGGEGQSRHVVLRDVASGQVKHTLSDITAGYGSVAAFSPDGKTLAVSGSAGKWPEGYGLHLFDVGTGKWQRKFAGHRSTITAAAFSPDGKRLATGGSDSTVLVWDLAAPP